MTQWSYETRTVEEGGEERIASLASVLPVDAADKGNLKPAFLHFRDHPTRRHFATLELGSGHFYCPVGCEVTVAIDDRPAMQLLASQPVGELASLHLHDPRGLWYELEGAKMLKVTFKAENWRRYTLMFSVAGLDRQWFDWDEQLYARTYREEKAAAQTQG